MNQSAQQLWQTFTEKYNLDSNRYHTVWSFGNTPKMADELLQLVLLGKKRGTSSLQKSYEWENQQIPKPGDYSILLDGNDKAQAIIQSKVIDILPYKHISEVHSYLEGEGEQSLAYWQKAHRLFFETELQSMNETFSEELLIIYELFDVVYQKQQ